MRPENDNSSTDQQSLRGMVHRPGSRIGTRCGIVSHRKIPFALHWKVSRSSRL